MFERNGERISNVHLVAFCPSFTPGTFVEGLAHPRYEAVAKQMVLLKKDKAE
jgi:hypothetical protein